MFSDDWKCPGELFKNVRANQHTFFINFGLFKSTILLIFIHLLSSTGIQTHNLYNESPPTTTRPGLLVALVVEKDFMTVSGNVGN